MKKIALEAHPGFIVYNPETMLRLRDATSEVLGANFDPSHFFWQGIDPVKAVRKLAGAIHHVHAKDTGLYKVNADYDGYLDTKPYSDEANRAWIFRTVGYGHGADFWADFVSTLRMVGYDGTLSMEHEDSLMSPNEGLRKGVEFLQSLVLRDAKGAVTWAYAGGQTTSVTAAVHRAACRAIDRANPDTALPDPDCLAGDGETACATGASPAQFGQGLQKARRTETRASYFVMGSR